MTPIDYAFFLLELIQEKLESISESIQRLKVLIKKAPYLYNHLQLEVVNLSIALEFITIWVNELERILTLRD